MDDQMRSIMSVKLDNHAVSNTFSITAPGKGCVCVYVYVCYGLLGVTNTNIIVLFSILLQ